MANECNFDFAVYESDDESDLSLRLSSSDESDSSDAEETELPERNSNDDRWSKGPNLTPTPKRDFHGPSPGPTTEIPQHFRELDFFRLFFTMDIVLLVVQQTNLFAEQSQAVKGRDPHWFPVTEEEMNAWLAIRIVMSVNYLPTIEMYWAEHFLYGGHKLAHFMTRDRFQKICQYLHVADNTTHIPRGQTGYDRLHKVRDMLERVRQNCLRNYNAHRNTSIDEAMIAFRGRLGFLQYVPSKPTKYGIKVWMRADPENGYVNDFQVYTGKDERTREGGLSARVVLDLSSDIRGRHHIINCDNFFSSPHLCMELLKRETYVRGTVRCNRKGFPKAILHAKCVKKQGEMVTAQKGEMVAAAWKDKKVVTLLSTAEDPADLQDTIARKQRDGTTRQVPCPSIVKRYNDHMNGVDRADQLRVEFPTYRTSKRWWQYIFWFLFDICVCNAFVLMRESPRHQLRTRNNAVKARTMLSFRIALSEQLIGQFQSQRKRKRVESSDPTNTSHWPIKVEKRGRCRNCSKHGLRKEVRYRCSACDIPLCPECFLPFHTGPN